MAIKDRYEIANLGPGADGWRAVIQVAGRTKVMPLVGWAVVHWTRREPDGTIVEDHGQIMAGLIADQRRAGEPITGFLCAEGDDLVGYLGPDMPDPVAESAERAG